MQTFCELKSGTWILHEQRSVVLMRKRLLHFFNPGLFVLGAFKIQISSSSIWVLLSRCSVVMTDLNRVVLHLS